MTVNQPVLLLPAPSSSLLYRAGGAVAQLHLAWVQCRPWSELVDRNSLSKPASVEDVSTRLRQNFSYYHSNYIIVLAASVCVSILFQPLLLFPALIFHYFLRIKSFCMPNCTIGNKEILVVLLILTVVLAFTINVISTLLTTLGIGLGLVAVHATFHAPKEALFIEESAPPIAGYASFQGSYQSAVLNRV